MLFDSISFIIFFIIVTPLYFLLPHKFRWFLLLAASCVFYMAFVPVYIFILGFTIVVDYIAGILIEKENGVKRKLFLSLSLVANIGILIVFKYYNFISGNINSFFFFLHIHAATPYLNILLPIGLSFHTFQAMSYTIEVYRGRQKAVRNFGIYSLYVMFYPQLVAGPIERPQNLIHQFYEKHDFDYDRLVKGLRRILWGFFKKIVIADRLALYVNATYSYVDQHTSPTLLLATIFFSLQIYCDFSGYVDIALGAAEIMGFNLMENFRRPYFSKSISEFWSRWHISLSTWFKDYLYIPLGGNKVSIPRWYFNLTIVFLISGIWHGANWTYVVWGLLNGFYLVFAIVFSKLKTRLNRITGVSAVKPLYSFIQIITTFFLISFAFIFFRANTITDAFKIVKKIFSFKGKLFMHEDIIYGVIGLAILFVSEIIAEYFPNKRLFFKSKNSFVRFFSYVFIIILMLTIGVFDGGQFIYFKF